MECIKYSYSFIRFMNDNKSNSRICQILTRLLGKRYSNNNNIITTSEINYITFRNDGTISYLPNGKECIYSTNEIWGKENRQNGKAGKIIRKLFTKKSIAKLGLKDSDFECFSNTYKSTFNDDGFKFEILNRSSIPDVYDMELYQSEGSCTLQGSCMNGDSNYLDIYANCTQLRIVVITDKNGLLAGRCLLWTINEEITLCDRFYVSKDCLYHTFIDFAEKNKFWYKKNYLSYANKNVFINPDGEEITKQFRIETDTDFDYYPYIDTFTFGCNGYLTNESNNTNYEYCNTDGTRDGDEDNHDNEVWDDFADEWIDEDYASYIDSGESRYRDRSTHYDNTVSIDGSTYHVNDCNIVEVNNTYYTIDSSYIAQVNGDWYLSEDTCYSEIDGEDYLLDDCVYSDSIEDYILKDDATLINGKWYHCDSDEVKNLETEEI